ALVAALTFASSLNHLVNRPALYGWDWGATLWATGGYGNVDAPKTDEILGADEHVAGWSNVWFGSAIVDGRNLPLLGMAPGSAVTPPLASGRATSAANEVVLGTATITALHKAVGDTVRLGDDRDGRELTIVGTAVFPTIGVVHGEHPSLGVGGLVAPELVPGYGRNLSELENAGGNTVFVRFKPGTDGPAEVDRLRQQANDFGGGFQTIEIAARYQPAEIVNASDAGAAPALLAAALTVAAVLSLALALVSAVRRRRRDLALVKSLGFTRRQVGAVVAWQATATTTVAVLVGVPAGVVLGRWLWIIFARQLDVVPRPEVPTTAMALLVLAALVVTNLVALVPARTARRVRPAVVLRSD
ncbi:MAG: ABC transporter permease, partial [Acidimicrobiales bacterium]